ncbi:MAG: hypothetical protein WCV70_02815 [Patescibacteria group bacterium]|jgi:hypothetical protein
MNTIILLAEVLASGKGCPVCGKNKSDKARTCRNCFEVIGFEATKAVDSIVKTADEARIGNNVANAGGIARENIWEPVLANLRIDRDAKYNQPGQGIEPYWECRKSVKGGFIPVYVFGAEKEKAGSEVTALIELKNKETKKGKISYLRAQAVDGSTKIKSNVKLAVNQFFDVGKFIVNSLPSTQIIESGRRFSVGFLPVA